MHFRIFVKEFKNRGLQYTCTMSTSNFDCEITELV